MNSAAINKTAAFHVYADLSQIKNYGKLVAKFCESNRYIYFECESHSKEAEIILPIDENDSSFSIDLIRSIANKNNKREDILKVKLGITSVDFTTIYYDFKFDLESPFSRDQLLKVVQKFN